MRVCSVFGLAIALFFLGVTSAVNAQPLVTGDLSVYYSFDEVDENGLFADGSGNGLNGLISSRSMFDANEDGLADIRLDTGDKVRGAGSARFDTDPNDKEDYIAICDPENQPEHNEGCGEPLEARPSYVPSTGFTIAAWVKAENVGQDQSVYQSRAGGGGFIHTQIQGNGNTRIQLRGDANSDNVVAFNEPPGGESVAFDEWIHFAATYDKGPDPNGLGQWAFYYNGEKVAGGDANGSVAGDPTLDTLGDWGRGAFIGLVPDFNRELVGWIDEFYLYTRALSADEIQTLFALAPVGPRGDFDGDGDVDVDDVNLLSTEIGTGGANVAKFDLTNDGKVDGADLTEWVTAKDVKNTWIGDADLNGEFNTGDLVQIFQAGKFEQNVQAGWHEGDWTGNLRFDTGDLVAAFQDGGFEKGPKAAAAAVPEPGALSVCALAAALALLVRRRRR